MQNRVYLDEDNILIVEVAGDQTAATVNEMGEAIKRQLDQLAAKPARKLILDDIRKMGKVDTEGRKAVVTLAKTLPYDKLAMVGGGNGLIRFGANLILQATGRGEAARYFNDISEATAWLTRR